MITLFAIILSLGSYTDEAHTNGLYTLELNEKTGALKTVASYPTQQAIYQDRSSDGRFLYTCARGGIESYEINGAALSKVDFVALDGTPCHISVMPDGAQVNWADYSNGRAGCVAVTNGKFAAVTSYQLKGSGPNLPRQNAAHCHQALPTPDGKSFCVVDLGLDEIVTYPSAAVFKTEPKGAGPRHALFHPNGRLAFVLFELGNLLGTYSWDEKKGFAALDLVSTLPEGKVPRGNDQDLAAALRFTPDQKRVVISNRGENSLVTFDYDEATGKLKEVARSLLPGSWPRDFDFVTSTLALVTMERTGDVHVLRYDAATGAFQVVSTLGGFYRPVAMTKLK